MWNSEPQAEKRIGILPQPSEQKAVPAIGRWPATTYPCQLTRREIEVLTLVAEGLTNNQIAERLFLSPVTVNRHLTSIYSKLDVKCRCAATRFALEHGFV